MSLVTSFFNKTVFKSNFKRMWWISALGTIMMFLFCTLPFYSVVDNDYIYYGAADVSEYVVDYFQFSVYNMVMVMAFIMAFAMAAFLFGYLNKVNSCSCLHGLPLTRTQLYFTHFISATVHLIIPFIINALMWISPLVSSGVSVAYIFKAFCIYLVYGITIMSLVTFIGMLTGNSIAQCIFSVIAMMLPLYFAVFVVTVCSNCLYGYNIDYAERAFEAIMKYVYIGPREILSPMVLIYIGLSAVFIAAGYLLYKVRALETCGELMSFTKLKNVFKVLFSFCAGILGYLFMTLFWNIKSTLIMLPFAFIGLVVAHMLANKSFSLKGIIKPFVVSISLVLALFAVVEFDLTGFEKRVPDVDDVAYVELMDIRAFDTFYDSNGVEYVISDVYEPKFSGNDEVQIFLDMHKYFIDNAGNETYTDDISTSLSFVGSSVDFVYTLKNGKKMYRSYSMFDINNDGYKYLEKIYGTQTFKAYEYPIFDNTEKTYLNAVIRDVRNTGSSPQYTAQSPEFDKIIKALIADRQNLTYKEMSERDISPAITRIDITYSKEGKDKTGTLTGHHTQRDTYVVGASDKNTLEVLEEIGFFDIESIYTTADGLESVTVSFGSQYNENSYYTESERLSKEVIDAYYARTALEQTYEQKEAEMTEVEDETYGVRKYEQKEQTEALFNMAFPNKDYQSTEYSNEFFVSFGMDFVFENGNFNYIVSVPLSEIPEFIIKDFS